MVLDKGVVPVGTLRFEVRGSNEEVRGFELRTSLFPLTSNLEPRTSNLKTEVPRDSPRNILLQNQRRSAAFRPS
jgi:hypothetical protein